MCNFTITGHMSSFCARCDDNVVTSGWYVTRFHDWKFFFPRLIIWFCSDTFQRNANECCGSCSTDRQKKKRRKISVQFLLTANERIDENVGNGIWKDTTKRIFEFLKLMLPRYFEFWLKPNNNTELFNPIARQGRICLFR